MKRYKNLWFTMFVLTLALMGRDGGAQHVFNGTVGGVSYGHWVYEAINTLEMKQILEGYPDDHFRGRQAAKRCEVYIAIYRLFKQSGKFETPANDKTIDFLLDVFAPTTLIDYPNQTHSFGVLELDPVGWWYAAEKNLEYFRLLRGYPDDFLRSRKQITRAEMATFIARLLERLKPAPALTLERAQFRDVDGDEWYFGSILVAAGSGVMAGYADHTFRPQQPLTRFEMTMALYRVLLLAGLEGGNHP